MIDRPLMRWFMTLTPSQRLDWLQAMVDSTYALMERGDPSAHNVDLDTNPVSTERYIEHLERADLPQGRVWLHALREVQRAKAAGEC